MLESRPEPVAGPGEIIVHVGASGLCGTDIHNDLFRRELTIVGSYTNPFTMDRALALLASGHINWEALITHRYPLRQLDEVWATHRAGAGLKVCVLPTEAEAWEVLR